MFCTFGPGLASKMVCRQCKGISRQECLTNLPYVGAILRVADDSPRASRKRSAAASNAFTHGLGHLPRYTLYRNRYKIWVRSTASGDQTVYSTCRREWQMKIVISYSYFLRHYGGLRPSGRTTRRLISHAQRTGNRISTHPHRAQPQASRTSRGCGKRFPTMVLTSRLA